MLEALSGRTCTVYSSCIISYRERGESSANAATAPGQPLPRTHTRTQVGALVESTAVRFASLPPDDIAAYIDTNEPYTKSGGFGLQSLGGTLVEGIVGDYYVVEGFPCVAFARLLRSMLAQRLRLRQEQGGADSHIDVAEGDCEAKEGRKGGKEEEWDRLYAAAVVGMRAAAAAA